MGYAERNNKSRAKLVQYQNKKIVTDSLYGEMKTPSIPEIKRFKGIRSFFYKLTVFIQSILWLFGISVHNRIFNECVPDFSCCMKCHTRRADRLRFLLYHYKIIE
jgi:hypothetical protein